jgi:hypothetical protein
VKTAHREDKITPLTWKPVGLVQPTRVVVVNGVYGKVGSARGSRGEKDQVLKQGGQFPKIHIPFLIVRAANPRVARLTTLKKSIKKELAIYSIV